MDNTLKNVVKDVSFGIEFETCFHVMEKVYKDSDDALMGYFKFFNKNLTKIRSNYNEKGSQFHAFLSLDSSYRPEQYDNWIILPDDSVMCSSIGDKELDNECYKNGKVVGLVECPDVDFFRLEIVTPKLKYEQKRILEIIWNDAVMANKTVYTSNDSQGLHINISHPKLNTKKFLKMWSSIEKEIISHLPKYRLDNIAFFAAPLYTMKDIYKESQGKYSSVGIRKAGTPDERLEIRIYQGTMNIDEILAWLDFCVFFLAMTVVYDESTNIKSLKHLFPKHSRKFLKYN